MPAQARRIPLPRAARIGIATAVTGVSFALPLVTTLSAQATTATPVKAVTATTVQAVTALPAQTVNAVPVAASAAFVAPLANPKLGTAYGVAGSMWASGHHTGQDFIASTGTPLRAVANGVVVKAGNGGAYGNQVEIKLADGHYAEYAHLSSIGVKIGQSVTVGQQIGLSGATGNVTGPHLHFEIRNGSEYGSDINPVAYLRAHGVAL
ncbi:peptidoglycan DD-metalloendopeptidase family protein [Streptomyces sp. FH025]|nr:peptidoglycan DD-metalloendopeptidase family protein [Streptomyces sp. FH025]